MYPYYGLSEAEYQLMKLFWEKNTSLQFHEILSYCNDELHLNWAATTAQTYLGRLIMKGVLETDGKRYRKSYKARLSEQDLSQKYAKQVVDESFGGSIKNLLASLTGGTKLTKDDVAELKQILDDSLSDPSDEHS